MSVSLFCFLASYTLAFGLEWVRLLRAGRFLRVLAPMAATAGLVAHTWFLWSRSAEVNLPPLLSSSRDWFLVLAWMAILFYLVLTSVDDELPIGIFLLPLVLILIGSAYFVSTEPNPMVSLDASRRGWVMLHATLLVFGIAGVIVGFVLSMMYLVQHRRLKHKQTGQSGMLLPSLERLSRLNWWAVVLTVPLLTLGMLTGVVLGLYGQEGTAAISFRDPVILVNGVVWLIAVVLFVWLLQSGRHLGKRVAWRTVWAFGLLLVTILSLQMLVIDTWHT